METKQLSAVNNFVIIRRFPDEEIRASGLIIHVDHSNKDFHGLFGTVLSVDNSKKARVERATDIQPGDVVLFNKYDSLPFDCLVHDEPLDTVNYSQIYALIK